MTENDHPRLIENAFPLKQASLDSVHEKNVRHGHISTLHIWPARRPLAACRAALIATLLPDPGVGQKPEGMSEDDWQKEITRRRTMLCEKIGGKLEKVIERKKMPNGRIVEREKEITKGGILHWGRETENKADLDWFRQEIRKAYGGRAPRVLDPFAGGGSIPLEAMRLGCETTAVDINPVAWFILKCTLEYPQKLVGQTRPLPEFILKDRGFMEGLFKAKGLHKTDIDLYLEKLGYAVRQGMQLSLTFKENPDILVADLAWHVRAWGRWVLDQARQELAQYYPTYAEFEPLDKKWLKPYENQPMQLLQLKEDGTADLEALNAEFSEEYLNDPHNPRWVAKPTVAYLWARTVQCKNCRATVPLLKTRWLCKKARKRILLTMEPKEDRTGVNFGIKTNVPVKGGNSAQRREHDRQTGAGTMSRAGAKCPLCSTIMTMQDIRLEGQAGRLGEVNTAVVVEGHGGKEYRSPILFEVKMYIESEKKIEEIFGGIPLGVTDESIVVDAKRNTWCVTYGVDKFYKLFNNRQLISLGVLINVIHKQKNDRRLPKGIFDEAIFLYLAAAIDRMASMMSKNCRWENGGEFVVNTFVRFALPILWDYVETNPLSNATGNFLGGIEWISLYINHALQGISSGSDIRVVKSSVLSLKDEGYDVIITDPPYYDAIGYSVVMDFFTVWLNRTAKYYNTEFEEIFKEKLAPKWDHQNNDGELIDDSSRHDNDKKKSKLVYEDGMYSAFRICNQALSVNGRLILVFAHKHPLAWEILASAVVRAGFVVNGSWPIQTERGARARAHGSAALSSSIWLVCKKRPATARPGWDNRVLEEMRQNIREKLRQFWDAGIRGPDFVWAATGPALEAFSKHPVVKKANDPGAVMTVGEFLTHVRRLVVEFVVGRVLTGDGETGSAFSEDRLDEITAYYLLHRHDFGLEEAPAGACILYAISCGISDKDLSSTWDLILYTRGKTANDDDIKKEDDDNDEAEVGSGNKIKLKKWSQRKGVLLGYEAPRGRPVPLIDRVHRLMHLWTAGDRRKVDEYIDENGLRRQELFKRLLQSLIELSNGGSEERALLESLSNHIQSKGALNGGRQNSFDEQT